MPQVGEIRRSSELGYKSKRNNFIFASCKDCGKERWVETRYGRSETLYCHGCGVKRGANKDYEGYCARCTLKIDPSTREPEFSGIYTIDEEGGLCDYCLTELKDEPLVRAWWRKIYKQKVGKMRRRNGD